MDDEKCVECAEDAIGECEACGASICPDHESGEYNDVYTCKDAEACSRRIEAKGE